jgi:hypothetical protein
MKRVYFGLLLLMAAIGFACQSSSNNNNATPNVNANASPNTNASPTIGSANVSSRADVTTFHETVVVITIADKDGKPYIASVMPDPVSPTLEAPKIQWVVVNQSKLAEAEGATVDVGQFRGIVNPADDKPFGAAPCDNTFQMLSVIEGQESRLISNPLDPEKDETGYKYSIALKQRDGKLIVTLDPQIIVGDRLIKRKETPATRTASPTPTPVGTPAK